MFVVIQNYRINLNNVYEYYMEEKILYIVDIHGRKRSYFFSSVEKTIKVLDWLDSKTKVHQINV